MPSMPMDNQMPPMGGNDIGMGNDPMMGNDPIGGDMEDPMMDDEMGGEENDPKKEIQKLSGQLSQKLRSYNDEQEKPDTDLNKYVAGMVIPQATKSMTSDEKAEVINKIKKGMTDDDLETDDSMEGMDDMGGDDNSMGDMPMESKHNLDNIINEIIGSLINGDEKENREEKKITNKRVTNKNPFVSNR